MSSMFFFGAGASIDAGLADAFDLTKNIYKNLRSGRDEEAVKIFGLVVAKIISRKVREGGSPFERVNVEEVYDGIQKLVGRDADLLSEFVIGWDPALSALRKRVSEREIDNAVAVLLSSIRTDGALRAGRITVDSGGSRDLRKIIYKIANPSSDDSDSHVEGSLIRALVASLQHDDTKIGYFQELIAIAKSNAADVASLNYDLVAERAAEKNGLNYEYGLGRWNEQKIVSFPRSSSKNIRILKLHGSLNWFGSDDDIEVREEQNKKSFSVPTLVFGGAGQKLRINGPFLQLRHEFQVRLMSTNSLVIVGYSFQDEHLNSIIRRWTNTRRKAKLVVVDPCPVTQFADKIGMPYTGQAGGKGQDLSVDLIHIKNGAAGSLEHLKRALGEPISLFREKANGFLPHIHFRSLA